MRDITEIILHCSATWSRQDIGLKEITQWHTTPKSKGGRGWDHVGYHFIIRRDGRVEKGCPLEVRGYHCSGHNANSIGICMVGGGPMGEDNNFAVEQFDSLAELILDLRKKFPLASIHGHNEYAQKACPVFSVANFLKVYGISRYPWDLQRWPHFRPAEFTGSGCTDLWGTGSMPKVWELCLDALEKVRGKYGKPMVVKRSEYRKTIPMMSVDIKVPEDEKRKFIDFAMDAGFVSARAVDNGVRVYMEIA